MVRPWKASSKAMIAGRFVYARAIFTAFSTGLGSTVNEESLLWKLAGRDFVHALGKADVAFIGRDLDAGVEEFFELSTHRVDYGLLAMAGISASDTAGEIEVVVAVDIFEPRVFRFSHIDRRAVRKPAGHSLGAAGGQRAGVGARDRGA